MTFLRPIATTLPLMDTFLGIGAATPMAVALESTAFGLCNPTVAFWAAPAAGAEAASAGGGAKLPLAEGFPKTFVADGVPNSNIIGAIAEKLPDAPVKVTAIKNPRPPSTAGGQLANGHIILVGGGDESVDITGLPVDISVVPQWHADEPHGGGEIGGIAQAWFNRMVEIGEGGQVLPRDGFMPVAEALDAYYLERAAQSSKSFQIGTTIAAKTDIDDPSVAPAYLVHIASVPPNRLKYSRESATGQDRTIFVAGLVRDVLERIRDGVVAHDRRLQKLGRPVRVAMPMLSTGPDGAVTLEECAVILLSEIGKFCEENPGYEFVIPVNSSYGDWRRAEELEQFIQIMQGDATALKGAGKIRPRTPDQMLEEIIRPFCRPPPTGSKFDRAYFNDRYDEWLAGFTKKITGDASTAKSVADRFTTSSHELLVTSLFHYATLELGKVNENGFVPPTLIPQNLKKFISETVLKSRAYTVIMGKLKAAGADKKFGGDKKMNEIMAVAVAQVLEEQSSQKYKKLWEEFEQKLKQQKGAIDEMTRQLAEAEAKQSAIDGELAAAKAEVTRINSALTGKQRTIDLLKKSVEDQAAGAQEEIDRAQAELEGLQKRLREKQAELKTKEGAIRRLEDDISNLRVTHSASQQSHVSTSRQAASFSTSFSRGG